MSRTSASGVNDSAQGNQTKSTSALTGYVSEVSIEYVDIYAECTLQSQCYFELWDKEGKEHTKSRDARRMVIDFRRAQIAQVLIARMTGAFRYCISSRGGGQA